MFSVHSNFIDITTEIMSTNFLVYTMGMGTRRKVKPEGVYVWGL